MINTGQPPSPVTADEAFERLKAGNERFVAGTARFPTVQKEVLAALAIEQRPYATVMGCSDSRVPPELVFDAGFGELFVIRVAGNVMSPEVKGSVQYAYNHLQTKLFVVLGHEGCGAVTAALAMLREGGGGGGGAKEREHIAFLLERIVPGLGDIDPTLSQEAQVSAAVEANVRWSMRQILEEPGARARVEKGMRDWSVRCMS